MRLFCACLLVTIAVSAHSQSSSLSAEAEQAHASIGDFGLEYPLSNDWVRATELLRKQVQSDSSPQTFDILLAAVYVPKSSLSETNPFFSVYAYRQPATDCKKSFEAMIAHSHDKKDRPVGGVVEFSVASRDYFRLNMAHGLAGPHTCIICTTANGHLLVWNASAPNEKGLDAIASTVRSLTPLPPHEAAESAPAGVHKDDETKRVPSKEVLVNQERVDIPSELVRGLLIKKVNPIYPDQARAAYIEGTVVLRAEISKTGDITSLERVDGPIELAGSAITAVRQWKYRPYMLQGQPVVILTQIQVNYQLQR